MRRFRLLAALALLYTAASLMSAARIYAAWFVVAGIAMNLTIWFEVLTASLLLVTAMSHLPR